MNTTDPISRTNAVSLGDEDAVKEVLVQSVLGLWDVVNNLTRLNPSHRDRYRVTIFGSARAKPGTVAYEETKRAAHALAEMGCDIITGGGQFAFSDTGALVYLDADASGRVYPISWLNAAGAMQTKSVGARRANGAGFIDAVGQTRRFGTR